MPTKVAVKTCTACRRSRTSNDNLYCNELRSSAIGGVIVIGVAEMKRSGMYEEHAANVAQRCKYFQEEQ
jgi:glycine/serine hydroxymethyltransferase